MKNHPDANAVIAHTRCWIEQVVIKLNLCPFARQPFESGKVRCVVSSATQPETLRADLQTELEFLHATGADDVQTTLLIHPHVLNTFLDYNDFLDVADALIEAHGYAGEFQIASFHPHYQFAGTTADAAENYTNRSPYPILHILREAELERAIDSYAHPENIPQRNIRTLNELGANHLREILSRCMS